MNHLQDLVNIIQVNILVGNHIQARFQNSKIFVFYSKYSGVFAFGGGVTGGVGVGGIVLGGTFGGIIGGGGGGVGVGVGTYGGYGGGVFG